MQKFIVLIVFLGLFTLPMMAQGPVEVFGGYQYLRVGSINGNGDHGNGTGAFNTNGWDGSLSAYFNKFIGVTGDFNGSYGTVQGANVHLYSYSGGPVVAFREGKLNPFVHVLFGGTHVGVSNCSGSNCSQNGFTTLFGGGVDVKVNRAVAVRLAEFDYVYYHFSNLTTSNDNVRITTGIVARF